MEKSTSQKILKVICIIWIVFTVIGLILAIGVTALGGVGMFGVSSGEITGADAASVTTGGTLLLVMGVATIIIGIVDLIVGIFGLRGANDPRKIGVFFVLCAIDLVICVIGVIAGMVQGSDQSTLVQNIVDCVWPAICLGLSYNIKQQASNA
ncbi:MAG: hypothetical protein LKI25_00290 [Atopobiaceae bacterium]|jgi:hypothetical protein|nr:hypothetical protein [Atopobiaceae bacterium]MCI2172650.1 hypothetical protein [Atopobiaceae bacterium]MCI2206957.1 hypothetical protein [Atopobiaceae bacterium]